MWVYECRKHINCLLRLEYVKKIVGESYITHKHIIISSPNLVFKMHWNALQNVY